MRVLMLRKSKKKIESGNGGGGFDQTRNPVPEIIVLGYPGTGLIRVKNLLNRALSLWFELGSEWDDKLINSYSGDFPVGMPRIEVTSNMPDFLFQDFHRFEPDHRWFSGRKVLVLTRDPVEVMKNIFLRYSLIESPPLFHGTPGELVRDPIFGLDKYLKFYRRCYEDRHLCEDWVPLRFEDLVQNPEFILRNTLKICGNPYPSQELVERAVALAGVSQEALDENPSDEILINMKEHVLRFTPVVKSYIRNRVQREMPAIYGYLKAR